jgi:hypothetical protein
MPFDWREFVLLARSLLGENVAGSQEAAERTAVSRVYFAAYNHALKRACERDRFERGMPSADDHGRLKKHYSKGKTAGLARHLDQLRQWRNQCDYDDNVSNGRDMALSALHGAEKVFTFLS